MYSTSPVWTPLQAASPSTQGFRYERSRARLVLLSPNAIYQGWWLLAIIGNWPFLCPGYQMGKPTCISRIRVPRLSVMGSKSSQSSHDSNSLILNIRLLIDGITFSKACRHSANSDLDSDSFPTIPCSIFGQSFDAISLPVTLGST